VTWLDGISHYLLIVIMVKGKPQVAKSQSSRKSSSNNRAAAASPAHTTQSCSKTVKSSFSAPQCCGCGTVINDGTKALQCDGCMSPDIWKCADCLHLTGDIYDHLVSNSGVPLKWFCESCDKLAMDKISNPAGHPDKLDHLLTAIERMMEKYEYIEKTLESKCDVADVIQLDSRVKQIEEKLLSHERNTEARFVVVESELRKSPTSTDEKENALSDEEMIKFVVQEEMNKKTTEERDLENRKRNIIIYRVPEKKIDDVAERKKSDAVFVKDLLDGVFDIDLQEQDIEKMFRLGRWADGKVRPLLVAFRNLEQKDEIMSNLRKLKQPIDRFKGISISQDLHPKERQEIKQMLDEAKLEHSQNSSEALENYRFLVVGKGSRRKVIKVERKHPAV